VRFDVLVKRFCGCFRSVPGFYRGGSQVIIDSTGDDYAGKAYNCFGVQPGTDGKLFSQFTAQATTVMRRAGGLHEIILSDEV
jgi:hypothetical protein